MRSFLDRGEGPLKEHKENRNYTVPTSERPDNQASGRGALCNSRSFLYLVFERTDHGVWMKIKCKDASCSVIGKTGRQDDRRSLCAASTRRGLCERFRRG